MTFEIVTNRLTLTACPAQVARAASGGKRQIESLIGVRLDDDWLDEDGRGLLSFYDYQLRGDPEMFGWGLWLMRHNEDRVVFGSIGFKGKPNLQGTVEIGYGISPAYRQQGYTFEAACALLVWAWQDERVTRVIAECLPDNLGSKRILEKLGMTCTGKQGGYLKWYIDR